MSEQPQTREQQADLDVRETYTRKSEFAPNVTLTEETFFGHGWQPLTIAFLQALWFLPHNTPFDVPFLVSWFDRIGWKGANGKPLGEKVVRRELGLLRDAGYVQTKRLRGEGGQAVGIQYTVSQRRIDQPETGSWIPAPEDFRRSDHVSSMATRGESPHVANGQNRRSHHMPPLTTRGESPRVVNGAKPQVAPRGTNGNPPPHPPGGGGNNTTPKPPKTGPTAKAARLASAAALREDEYAPTPEQTQKAHAFLRQMPGKWEMNVEQADALAPLLASYVHSQELEYDTVLELVLREETDKDPVRLPASVMPARIRNLKRRTPDVPARPGTSGGLAPWCGTCNLGERPTAAFQRTVELPDGRDVPCKACHPKYTHSRSGAGRDGN